MAPEHAGSHLCHPQVPPKANILGPGQGANHDPVRNKKTHFRFGNKFKLS